MKKFQIYKQAILVFCALSIFSLSTRAQDWGETKMNIQYNVAVPTGTFRDFVSNTTGRAWNVNILYGITDRFAAGAELSYRNFYEKYPRQVYQTTEGNDISAVLTNTAEVIPFTVKGRYNFSPEKKLQPFASLGLGATIVKIDQYAGEFNNVSESGIGFAVIPEIGLFVPIGKHNHTGINLAASYSFLPYHYEDIDNLSHTAIALGVSLPLRR